MSGGDDLPAGPGGHTGLPRLLAALVEAAPIGVAVFDTDLRYLFVNQHLAVITGMAPEDHVGKRVADVSERLGDAVETILATVRDTADPLVDVEIRDDGPGGTGRVWRASQFPVRVGDEVVAVGATVIDVSDADQALAHEQAARALAEVAARRSARLHAVAAELASTVTTLEVVEIAIERFARIVADRATVVRTSGGPLEPLGEHGVAPDYRTWIQDVDLRESTWASPVLDGDAVWVADRAAFVREHPRTLMAQTDQVSASWCLLPLSSSRGVMGVLALHWNETQPFDEPQQTFLLLAAELIGSAMARAATHEELQRAHDRLRAAYDQRDRVARTLRAGLAPRALHLPSPLEIGAVLRLGSADQVGGDFYDGVLSADGSWLVSVGDVCGKGAEAAALTALVRYTIRAAAMGSSDHESILRTVNRALLDDDTGLFCALTLLRVEPAGDGTDVTVTLAGQHEARVRRVDGTVEVAGTFGSLVGVSPDLVLEPVHLRLGREDTLLAFTDGLVERTSSFGEEQLDDYLRELSGRGAARRAPQLVDEVVRAAFEVPGDRSDDVCVVAIGHETTG